MNFKGIVKFDGHIFVLRAGEFIQFMLCKAHSSTYFIHPSTDKMYRDVRKYYWWSGINKYLVDFIASSLCCLLVKVKHQRS